MKEFIITKFTVGGSSTPGFTRISLSSVVLCSGFLVVMVVGFMVADGLVTVVVLVDVTGFSVVGIGLPSDGSDGVEGGRAHSG